MFEPSIIEIGFDDSRRAGISSQIMGVLIQSIAGCSSGEQDV